MKLASAVASHRRILAEGSVFELLRRDPRVSFDAHIAHAGLIYDAASREILESIHRSYLAIAEASSLPLVAFTDTWRASARRISTSRFRGSNVNADNVRFLRDIADATSSEALVCGLTGPAGDAYRPDEAPAFDDALRYHATQIDELAQAEVDVIMAATLPSCIEARAIAILMDSSERPWMLSFVIRPDGTLLDDTLLGDAIRMIDDETNGSALGYSINCVHPSVLRSALATLDADVVARLVAFQANTSARSPEELDGLESIEGEEPESFAREIVDVARTAEISIVGGCCGTDVRHIEAIAAIIQREPETACPTR